MRKSIFHTGLLCIGIIHSAFCQKNTEDKLVLNEGTIMNELHQESLGQVAFMEAFIPFASFTESHFKSNVTMSNNFQLNIRIFLERTLTSYLHDLAPEMTVGELCENGNFMFSFLVDDQLIYDFKLPYGAGACSSKNEQTVYGVPLARQDDIDHWGRFLWQRFLYQGGGDDALSVGEHQLHISVQPYIDLQRDKKNRETIVGSVIAEGSVKIIREPIEVTPEQRAIQNIKKAKWPIYTMAFDQGLIESLNEQIANQSLKSITSIVVVKEGELALEEYFNGANRKTLHDTRSLTKSFTSSLIGIAIEQGLISSEKATLRDFYELSMFDNFTKAKSEITIDELLQMSSGFAGDDSDFSSPGNEENMYPTSDWVKFILDLPMATTTQLNPWQYFTGGVVVLGDILNQRTSDLEKFAQQNLFKPLNINKVKWQDTPTGVVNTAGSCQLAALDYAKYGQLYLNGGKWINKQVIPKAWIDQTLTKHQKLAGGNQNYGYLFWNRTFELNDKSYEAFTASGNGGNHIVIIKELDLVIVITSTAYNMPYAHPQSERIIESFLLPAFVAK